MDWAGSRRCSSTTWLARRATSSRPWRGWVPGSASFITVSDLEQAVHAVIRDCMGVREGDEVLVVCNPATIGLGERLRGEAGRAGADAVTALMAERASHAAEPPASIAAAMAAADVVLCPTVQSLSHTAARRVANEQGARIATLPGVTEELLARVMSADMAGLRSKGAAIAKL